MWLAFKMKHFPVFLTQLYDSLSMLIVSLIATISVILSTVPELVTVINSLYELWIEIKSHTG